MEGRKPSAPNSPRSGLTAQNRRRGTGWIDTRCFIHLQCSAARSLASPGPANHQPYAGDCIYFPPLSLAWGPIATAMSSWPGLYQPFPAVQFALSAPPLPSPPLPQLQYGVGWDGCRSASVGYLASLPPGSGPRGLLCQQQHPSTSSDFRTEQILNRPHLLLLCCLEASVYFLHLSVSCLPPPRTCHISS